MNHLPASTGWLWLKTGFELFRKQPGLLTMLVFANMLFQLAGMMVPVAGPIATSVLIPSFSMAILQACHQIGQGERADPSVLLTGFRAPALGRLCKLGAVYAVVYVAMAQLLPLALSDDLVAKLKVPPAGATPRQFDDGMLLAVLGMMIPPMLIGLLLSYAAPLAYWKQMKPGKAIFYSVFGVLGAVRPLMLLIAAITGMFMVLGGFMMAILGVSGAFKAVLFWMMMLFALLWQCALYASYRQIFGEPEAPDSKASPVPLP